MSVDPQEERNLQEAFAKCKEILSEFMDSGIIIGTVVNDSQSTYKWSQPWGNSFAVAKMIEAQFTESRLQDRSACECRDEED